MRNRSSAAWVHPDDRHHAVILVAENVAMVYEVADIESSEVHANRDARIGMVRVSVPVGHLDHVKVLALDRRIGLAAVDLEVVLRQHQEMDLMDMEVMVFQAAVLDPSVRRRVRRQRRW